MTYPQALCITCDAPIPHEGPRCVQCDIAQARPHEPATEADADKE